MAAAVLASAAVLNGCANSASHQVLKREYAGDDYLSCAEIDREKRKARVVIRGVEQDKNDMTGADVVDGVLWFPFNVIAKQSNYASATQAAEDRIESLTLLEAQKGCRSGATTADMAQDQRITQQLRQLNDLYKSRVLTKAEYIAKKAAILDKVGSESQTTVSAAPPGKPVPREVGRHWYQAEQAAPGCTGVELIASSYGKDVYKAQCPTGMVVLTCELGRCSAAQ